MKKVLFFLTTLTLLCLSGAVKAQQSLPYSYGFEDNDLAASGWTSVYTDNTPSIQSGGYNSSNYCFRFSSYNSASSYDQYLISPELDGTSGVVFQFYYKKYDYGSETFKVGYSTTTNDPSSFTWGDPVTASSTTWTASEEYTFPVGTKFVAIYYYSNYQYYLYVDDINLTVPSSCTKPGAITLGSIGTTTATINWTAGGTETSWNVYLTQGGSPVTGYNPLEVNTTPSCTFTGLTAATVYDVAVEAICGGNVSAQRTTSFTTALCEAADQCEITFTLTQYNIG